MTVDILRGAGTAEQVGQAERAVKAFRKLQPTLTSYARVLTGKKNVRVDMAARDNGSTDGTRIYFRPPIALGDSTPHNRHLCDKRDEDGRMICPACAIREKVLVTIMHEIAHIAFDSFQKATDRDKVRAIEFAIKESKGQYADRIKARINGAPEYVTSNFMGLANLINEYLPFLINCLEDARVNHEMFKVRPGLKRMFTVDTVDVFEKGFENRDADGILRTKHWREAPLNSQAMIGVFCKASGYDYSDWFHPKVIEALNDAKLTELVDRMDGIESAGAVYNLAFQVLARLRELGFCGTPQDPDPDPEPEEEYEDDSQDQDPSSEGEAGEPEDGGGRPEGDTDSADGETEPELEESGNEPGTASGDESPERSEGEADGDPSEDSSAESEDESGGEVDEQEGTGNGSDSEEPGPDSDSSSDDAASDGDADGADSDSDAGEDEAGEGSTDDGSDTDSNGSGSAGSTEGEGELDENSTSDSSDSEASPEGEASVPSVPSSGEQGTEKGEPSDSGPAPEGGGTGIESGGETPEGEDSDAIGETSNGSPEDGEADEPVDSGADDGYGGTSLLGSDDEEDTPPMGEPDDVDPIIKQWGQHDEKPKSIAEKQEETAVDRAIVQGIYFTRPSKNVYGVTERRFDEPQDAYSAWRRYKNGRKVGQMADIEVPESILQPAILKMRRAFTDNQIGSLDTNRRSGRVNRRVLGRRAWNEDDRLFSKKTQPGKKDYEVIIGMDISGSTIGRNLALEKRAIMAQATMLDRVGVPFSIIAHTGDYHDHANSRYGLDLQVYHIKDHGEPWNAKTIERLQAIGHSAANLDGHALEYLRKRADESRAAEKIILYYSDGKMPAENHDEELDILTSEITLCRQKGYTLLGVGIRTDSPTRHGLDTVEVHEDSDLVKVVEHLAKRLSGSIRR